MEVFLGLLLFLVVSRCSLCPVIVVGLGIWVFRPLDRAAKDRLCPTQFTIVDFFCLFFIVQAPTALIHSKTFAKEAGAAVYVLDGFVWICCGLIWWKSVEVMSRAGIHRPWHRIVFLTVVFPVTLVASIATPILPFAFLGVARRPSDDPVDRRRAAASPPPAGWCFPPGSPGGWSPPRRRRNRGNRTPGKSARSGWLPRRTPGGGFRRPRWNHGCVNQTVLCGVTPRMVYYYHPE